MPQEPSTTAGPQDAMQLIEVYKEVGTNYRYFLTWRHRLFAGYLAVVAALAIGFTWVYVHAGELLWVVFASWLALSLAFWALEGRNRDGYRTCLEVGESLEAHIPNPSMKMYHSLRSPESEYLRHSVTINLLLGCSALAAVFGLAWSFCPNNSVVV